ncbi:MAG: hypothetical protein AAF628_37870 [Planctomycetota bacterium]
MDELAVVEGLRGRSHSPVRELEAVLPDPPFGCSCRCSAMREGPRFR